MSVFPSHYYRDPIENAMRNEASRCTGCKHIEKIFDREICGIGRRELKKCKRFAEEKKADKSK